MPGPRADGCIACREGDTVLIGFRADADSSDEAPDQTESVNDSSGQDEPGESEPDLAETTRSRLLSTSLMLLSLDSGTDLAHHP